MIVFGFDKFRHRSGLSISCLNVGIQQNVLLLADHGITMIARGPPVTPNRYKLLPSCQQSPAGRTRYSVSWRFAYDKDFMPSLQEFRCEVWGTVTSTPIH